MDIWLENDHNDIQCDDSDWLLVPVETIIYGQPETANEVYVLTLIRA